MLGTDPHLFFFDGLQKIDAEEQAIYEEMLSAAGMVEEEARQRFRKLQEAKEVTQLWCSEHSMPLLRSGLVLHVGCWVLWNLDYICCMYVKAGPLTYMQNT